jgi:hypothetical protein
MGTVHFMNYQHIPDVRVVGVVGAHRADQRKAAEWGRADVPDPHWRCAPPSRWI